MKSQDIKANLDSSYFKIKIDGKEFTGVVLDRYASDNYWIVANTETRQKSYNVPSKAIKRVFGACVCPWNYA